MQDDRALEESIGRKLKALPELAAPTDLMPKVLASIRAKADLQWWQQPWSGWPLRIRLASMSWVAVVVAILYWGVAGWDRLSSSGLEHGNSKPLVLLAGLWDLSMSLFQCAGAVLKAFQPLAVAGGVIVLVLYLGCLGVASICVRQSGKGAA